jgi:hypothetical protein
VEVSVSVVVTCSSSSAAVSLAATRGDPGATFGRLLSSSVIVPTVLPGVGSSAIVDTVSKPVGEAGTSKASPTSELQTHTQHAR